MLPSGVCRVAGVGIVPEAVPGSPSLQRSVSSGASTQASASPTAAAVASFEHAQEAAAALLRERIEFRELLGGVFAAMRTMPGPQLREMCFAILVRRLASSHLSHLLGRTVARMMSKRDPTTVSRSRIALRENTSRCRSAFRTAS